MRTQKTLDSILIWFKISKIHNENILSSNRILKGFGLTLAQFDVIAQLGSVNERTQSELTEKLLVTKGNISQLLSTMEEKELVKRRQDWKTKYVSLTEEGRRIHNQVVPIMEDFQTKTVSSLTDNERTTLLSLLRKIENTEIEHSDKDLKGKGE